MEDRDEEEKHEAPEGGWGWVICFAYALNNMIIIPGFQIFSLLYHDVFLENGIISEMSVIVSVNGAFGMFLGLLNGPILGTFSYRKVAIVGASFMFIGNFMTSQASTFFDFLIFYSILVSIGANLVMSSYTLALNTYFVKKRGMATGMAMTATGIGPIVMPLIMKSLMSYYGSAKYPGLILSALSLHSLVGALLLHPVKWHRKSIEHVKARIIKGSTTIKSEEIPLKELNGEYKNTDDVKKRKNSIKADDSENKIEKDENKTDLEQGEVKTENQNEKADDLKEKHKLEAEELLAYPKEKIPRKESETSAKRLSRRKLISLFNFQLFKDPGYVCIIIGLSLAFVGEMNFSLMIPSILQQMQYSHEDTAVLMAVIAGADISSRFTTPFLNKYSRNYARLFFTLSLNFGIFAKLAIVFYKDSFSALVVVAVGLGIAKGFRSVYMTLIIPNYVSLDLLPSATGFQMFSNGLALGLMGKIFGIVNTKYGNDAWIYTINCFTLSTVILWTVEYFLMKKKRKRKPPQ